MDASTRIDVVAKQFERGLQSAGCTESTIAQIVELIKQKRIDAIGFFASDQGFKVYELIIRIDWEEHNKHKNDSSFQAADIIGLQKSGEISEVKRNLNDLVRKSREKQLPLSYWVSFCGALKIIKPKEYLRLKKQLGFEERISNWMNDIGQDIVDTNDDLQEVKIRFRDIQEVPPQDRYRIEHKKVFLRMGKEVARQLSCSAGDYCVETKDYPINVSLTFQGEKKAAKYLGLTSLNEPACAELKQAIIASLIRKEEKRLSNELVDDDHSTGSGGNRKTGLNDPCPCGSGLKYKDCHGKTAVDISHKPISGGPSTKPKTKGANPTPRNGQIDVADKDLLQKSKRVNLLLTFNLFTAFLSIVIILFSKVEIPSSPWNHIIMWSPVVSVIICSFAFRIYDDEKSGGWTKIDTLLSYSLGASIAIGLCKIITLFISFNNNTVALLVVKIGDIVLMGCAIPFLVLTTIRGIQYLKKNNSSDRHITAIRISAMVLYSVLAVLLLILIYKQFASNSLNSSLNIGDTVTLGSYEQDGDSSNGKEAIDWTVKSVDNGKALLLSDVCLYAMPYNSDNTDNSWTNSDLRKWLNDVFYQSAFSSAEQGVICDGKITTERLSDKEGHTYGEIYGEAEVTIDKVFVPDLSEFYMLTSELNVSPVAKEVFLANNTTYGGENYRSMFWTRSPYGEQQNFACGFIPETEQRMNYLVPPTMYAMVRPAIYIDVELYSNMSRDNQDQANPTSNRGENAVGGLLDNSQTKPHYYCYDDGTTVYDDGAMSFGPGVWTDPNESVDFNSYIYQVFCERLERDPVMAAAILACADKQMGTRFAGSFYSEIKDDWVAVINDTAKAFIEDMDLWTDETTAFVRMLENTSEISIRAIGGGGTRKLGLNDPCPCGSGLKYKNCHGKTEGIETIKMQSGDEQPTIIGPVTLKTTETDKYLCFTITVKDTKITLLYLIDLGFQPVI